MRKEFNSQRIFLVHQHGRRFIVSEHQYGHRDVMWKRSTVVISEILLLWLRDNSPLYKTIMSGEKEKEKFVVACLHAP